MDIIEDFKKIQQIIDNETKILVVSPVFAKRLIEAKIDCPSTILFQLNKAISEKEAFVLQGDLRDNMLSMYKKGLVELYTLKELQGLGI